MKVVMQNTKLKREDLKKKVKARNFMANSVKKIHGCLTVEASFALEFPSFVLFYLY